MVPALQELTDSKTGNHTNNCNKSQGVQRCMMIGQHNTGESELVL